MALGCITEICNRRLTGGARQVSDEHTFKSFISCYSLQKESETHKIEGKYLFLPSIGILASPIEHLGTARNHIRWEATR